MKYERLTKHRDRPLTMSMWAGDSKSLQIYNRCIEQAEHEIAEEQR